MIGRLAPNADFWMPRIQIVKGASDPVLDTTAPANRAVALGHLRDLLHYLTDRVNEAADKEVLSHDLVANLSWHSARCTVIHWAGRAGCSPLAMTLQMHSKDPRMAVKYMRDRLTLPCSMVHSLVQDIKHTPKGPTMRTSSSGPSTAPPVKKLRAEAPDGEAPEAASSATSAELRPEHSPVPITEEGEVTLDIAAAEEGAEDSATTPPARPRSTSSSTSSSSSGDDTSDLDCEAPRRVSFFIKKGRKVTANPNWKYHVTKLDDPGCLACSAMAFSEAEIERMGSKPPAGARVCKRCMAARPDVAVLVGKWRLPLA
jgi:hypothetical protein